MVPHKKYNSAESHLDSPLRKLFEGENYLMEVFRRADQKSLSGLLLVIVQMLIKFFQNELFHLRRRSFSGIILLVNIDNIFKSGNTIWSFLFFSSFQNK